MNLKNLVVVLLVGFLAACSANNRPAPVPPKPPGPIVNPTPPVVVPPVAQNGKVFVPPFGAGSNPIPLEALVLYKPLVDNFSKVYADLKKPLFARSQADGGVALIYNIAGSRQRAYYIFRGGDGLLTRVSQLGGG